MKYMGSKRLMLTNGLGEAIESEARHAKRVVDLFTGSGALAWFAAERTEAPVYALDLQEFAVILARAVIGRTRRLDPDRLATTWLRPSLAAARRSPRWKESTAVTARPRLHRRDVAEARRICSEAAPNWPIWSAYGGHYFSPSQALVLDAALRRLPTKEPEKAVCHAAVIQAASYCAAAPGHTAQPFQPTATALPYIGTAWRANPAAAIMLAVTEICGRVSLARGKAEVGDAVEAAGRLGPGDLALVDPPYSAVQYSRFYHVLETIARREGVTVAGVGRYPPIEDRPSSAFSLITGSTDALGSLLENLATAGARVLLTFPAGASSNGLSGAHIVEVARHWFDVEVKTVLGRFSTLGGNNAVRASRTHATELILTMTPLA